VATLLTKEEYLATFVEPMRRLEPGESYKPVRISEYVAECIRRFEPPVAREQLQIRHEYLNGDQSFYHVLSTTGNTIVSWSLWWTATARPSEVTICLI